MTPAVDNQNVAWMCAVLLLYFDDYSSLGRWPNSTMRNSWNQRACVGEPTGEKIRATVVLM